MTTIDLPLWTLSRRSDPASSARAVAALASTGNLGRQEQEVLAALAEHGPCTSKQLSQRSGLDRHAVARRLSGLLHKGRVTRVEPGGECVWQVKREPAAFAKTAASICGCDSSAASVQTLVLAIARTADAVTR